MNLSIKASFWACNVCSRILDHGTFRYNCTMCTNYDQCEECTATMRPPHPHSLVRELAFGVGETKTCTGTNMAATIQAAIEIYSNRHCLGVRDVNKDNPEIYANSYSWQTYKTVGERSTNFGHGLRGLVEPRSYLGICAVNRPEWVMTDLACIFQSIISVPMFCLLNDHDTTFIINNTSISVVVCDKERLPKFLRLHAKCSSLRYLICMDPILETTETTVECNINDNPSHWLETGALAKEENGLLIYYMGDIEKKGSEQRYNSVLTEPDECLTIIYTSGSSGFPKGVMISEGAFRAIFQEEPSPSSGEYVSFSYQPLAWYGGRNHLIATIFLGGRAGFFTGNASRLMEELNLIRPTIFAAPPSIWNKIYSEFKMTLSTLTATADTQQNYQVEEELLQHFSKLMPSRCKTIAIVGALISPIVLDFVRRCFRTCDIIDGYGITECGGVAFDNRLDPTVIYRLESVPEMGFTLDDKPFPRGELLTMTAQMFSGYVNNPMETRAALTDDGFFRTGDIVELRQVSSEQPYVHIIDRKKNFFKLAQGQFVSPEYLQSVFAQSSLIEQIYIHGDLYDDCVTAVVVPNRKCTQAFALDSTFSETILRDLYYIGTKESLQKHEIPSRIIIDFEPFTVDNGLLTPSLKLCRPKLAAHYADQLKRTNPLEQRLKTIIEIAIGQPLSTSDEASFLAAGGNSLAAVRLSRMIHKDLGVTVPLSVLFEPEMNLKRLIEFTQNPLSSRDDSIVSRLLHDTELELNITIGKPRNVNSIPSTVFVTGTTGFAGAFLLFELLNKYPPDCKFVCLVRCELSTDPLDRIRQNLSFFCLWQESFRERIVPLHGDLAQTQFGLDDETYAALAAQIDIIFHCGAIVNFILPYSQLYDSNVCGTREIIRLATHAPTCIPVQYISTISVLPPGIVHEVHIDEISPSCLTNGYAQSKWVAEKLMAKANSFGLPVVIYRLGSMCGDTKTGACNPLDLHTIFITAILKINCYPVEALNIKLDTLPVDFAAESIVRLSRMRPDVYGSVYHIIHPDGGITFQNIVTSTNNCGVTIEGAPVEQWQTRLMHKSMRGRPFEPLVEFLTDSLFAKRSILSSEQFYSVVSQLDIPPMDHDYLKKWLTFILRNVVD